MVSGTVSTDPGPARQRAMTKIPLTLADLERIGREASHWPSDEDRLLRNSSTQNIIVDWECSDIRHATLWRGYKEAGDLLFSRIFAEDLEVVPVNFLHFIYPALFCYRHFVELALKRILIWHGQPRTGHNLKKLWEEVRQLIERDNIEDLVETLDAVGSIVLDFKAIDDSSERLRYALDKKKWCLIKLPLERISLREMPGIMTKLDNFLESIASYLGERNG
jgi:HEPN domain-containing protein